MSKILLLVLACLNLYASNIVENYRKSGADRAINEIEKELRSKEYWQEQLRDGDFEYGYYERDTNIIVTNKVAKNIKVFEYKNGKIKEVFANEGIITGIFGDKQKEGDLKTPVGVYDLLKRFVPQDQFYGQISYATSYPNIYDRVQKKTGYGIWIHGHPLNNKPRYKDNSEGCIVLTNDKLEIFDGVIKGSNALLLTYEDKVHLTNKDELSELLKQLFEWRYAWKVSDIDGYLNFYHKDFRRFDRQDLSDFSRLKRQIFAKKEDKTILFNDIAISPYPNEELKPLFKITYSQTYETKNHKFVGKKELYVDFSGGKMKILAEK